MDKDAVRIITTGYPSLDFILHAHNLPRVGETGLLKTTHTALRGQPGGCAANIAVACTRLGVKAGIIVQLGRDKTGDDFVRELEHEGVDCRLVRRIEGAASSTCLLVQDPQGNHQTFFYAGAAETNQFVPPDISGKPSWAVLTVGNPRTNLAVAEWAKEEGDPPLRLIQEGQILLSAGTYIFSDSIQQGYSYERRRSRLDHRTTGSGIG